MVQEKASSVDTDEIAKFEAMADEWWDESGKFKPLHKFNPTRIAFIRDTVTEHRTLNTEHNLAGLSLLDIGCGGGLIAEPMTRLGAEVTGIDASKKNIKIAQLHAQREGLDINYRCATAEELAQDSGLRAQDSGFKIQDSGEKIRESAVSDDQNSQQESLNPKSLILNPQYDIVLALEIIEHVADVESFVNSCCSLVKPGGLLFIATINRTVKSMVLAKIGAEYILRWLPRGTHDWNKFLKPSEINNLTERNGLKLHKVKGMSYNPLRDQWSETSDVAVNYIMVMEKPESTN